MSGPWGLIANYFNALGSNMSASEKARSQGERSQGQAPGMVYQSAPQLDRSNYDAGSPSTVGANLIGDYGKQFGGKLFAGAIQGEKDMMAPDVQATGAYTLGPTTVDSSQSSAPYENSAIARYLRNYGGYRL